MKFTKQNQRKLLKMYKILKSDHGYTREKAKHFLDYLNFELDNTAKNEEKFNLNYLLPIYNDCKMQII